MRRLNLLAIAIALILFSNTLLYAAQQTKVVDAVGRARINKDMTPDEARRLALKRARRAAIEEVAGMDAGERPPIYKADLINNMVLKSTGGHIMEQDILLNECMEEDGVPVCTVMIRANVGILDQRGNTPFSLKASVSNRGADTVNVAAFFHEGDELIVNAMLDSKGYLTIFEIDQGGNVSRLFPVEGVQDSLVQADVKFMFPDDQLRKKGLGLRARTYQGSRKADWSIMVVATRETKSFLEGAGVSPTVFDLLEELADLDGDQWAQVTLGYIVLK